jgi:twinkle protein
VKPDQHEESEFLRHIPCSACGSSDANSLYSDGHQHCFACGLTLRGEGMVETDELPQKKHADIPNGQALALKARGIFQETTQKWGYLTGQLNGKPVQIAVYRDEKRQPVAAKLRFPDKTFSFVGEPKQALLYGQWLWPAGGKMITITEGEIDALSVSQAQDNKWPVVSIPNGADGALKDIKKHYDFLASFARINIWFDNDKVGQAAAAKVAEALPPGKVHIVKADLKDANEYLKQKRASEIVNLIWRAEKYMPDGIVAGSDIKLDDLKKASARGYDIPYTQLNEMLHGLREAEITLLTAGSGIGKSTLAREIAYHLHQEHKLTIGNVFLEESKEKTAQGYVAIDNNIPLGELRANPAIISDENWERSMREVIQSRMYFYDHFGSLESANLLAKLRYLRVVCGCNFIILDHISIVVSGQEGSGEGERKDIDRLMTALRQLCEETGVGIIAIVHLRQPDGTPHEEGGRVTLSQLRGSGSLKQLSDNVVAVERNTQDEESKRFSTLRVLKNREFGDDGVAGMVEYVRKTGRLESYVDLGEQLVEIGGSTAF